MTSYKSRNNQRIKSSLARRIEPIQPSQDRYGEIKLQLDQLMDYSVDRIHYFPREHKWPAGIGYNIMELLNRAPGSSATRMPVSTVGGTPAVARVRGMMRHMRRPPMFISELRNSCMTGWHYG